MKHFEYDRKSSEEAERQALSIESQKEENAKRQGRALRKCRFNLRQRRYVGSNTLYKIRENILREVSLQKYDRNYERRTLCS